MFTGIVEAIGTVGQIQKRQSFARLTIEAETILDGVKIGDSIAVNGICLTVEALPPGCFSADVMHETLNRSSLSRLKKGSHVNLERAMEANGRFGGHIVAGHVDGVGKVTGIRRDAIAIWYTVQAEPSVLRYIVEKGSIAVDGVSLTVAQVLPDGFSVSVIPHTVEHTVLRERSGGDLVNLETDIIGKYVEKFLQPMGFRQPQSVITKEFLSRNGF